MATLHIAEYKELGRGSNGETLPVAMEPVVTSQALSYTTAATSAAFANETRYVYLQTDGTKAHVAFGTSPTATANSPLIVSDDGRFFAIPAGQSFKVSAYDGSS